MTLQGAAKSEPQAGYIAIVGAGFVFIWSFCRFHLWKFTIPYLSRGAAGENAGLPGSYILTNYEIS